MYITYLVLRLLGQQPRTYPPPRIPAARPIFVIQCLSSTWGNPEVGGGDNFFALLISLQISWA